MPFARQSPAEIAGVGLGLRSCHYSDIETHLPPVNWFEALTDNYLGEGGWPLVHLERIAGQYPLSLHGVGLSLGSTDPLDKGYLRRLKALVERFNPALLSDHLCWTGVAGRQSNDLLPLPYTRQAVRHVTDRIRRVQDELGRQILVENVSSYLSFAADEMPEWAFIAEVVVASGCGVLCDLNNIVVNQRNQGVDPEAYLSHLPASAIQEIHLAGYEDMGTHYLDTHGAPVFPEVWSLYESALSRWGDVPTLIEWDTNIPSFDTLLAEAGKASEIRRRVLGREEA